MNMFSIKTIAIISMLIDHFALFFFPQSLALRILGRISFPLIAWLIANGAKHTHDIDAYLRRLFFFALISQIPFEIGYAMAGRFELALNVLFTLCLGLLAIRVIRAKHSAMLKIGAVVATSVLAAVLNTDYGAAGVLSIVAFYIFFDNFLLLALSQSLILFVLPYIVSFLDPLTALPLARYYLWYPFEGFGLLALLFIYMYSGARGPKIQYFFYWFFPLQSFAILALKFFAR